MTLESTIRELCPESWWPSTISSLDSVNASGWLVQLCDGERVATGTGESIEEAIKACWWKIERGKLSGRLACLAQAYHEPPAISLESILANMDRPKGPPIRRRV